MIGNSGTSRYAWCVDGGSLRLSFDPSREIEAVCRIDFSPNKTLTGDEELFPDFDTERVAYALIIEMMKAALLQQRITMLDVVKDADEIRGLERKLMLLVNNDKSTGTIAREKKTVSLMHLQRDGMGKVMQSPFTGRATLTGDYGEEV